MAIIDRLDADSNCRHLGCSLMGSAGHSHCFAGGKWVIFFPSGSVDVDTLPPQMACNGELTGHGLSIFAEHLHTNL